MTRTIDSYWFRWVVRLAGLLFAAYVAMALLFGVDRLTNPVFGVVYVLVWVGLVPISLLFGPVWRTLNPLRTLHLLFCRAFRLDPSHGLFTLPAGVGVWPAAVGLFAFTWLELVARPRRRGLGRPAHRRRPARPQSAVLDPRRTVRRGAAEHDPSTRPRR